MTPEERFERIEKNLELLTEAVTRYVETSNEGMKALTASIAEYVQAANERMKQMEANLAALLRIITAEHSNG